MLIVDFSIDPLVVEALRKATLETGAEFNAILLNTFSQEEDPIKLQAKDDPHDLFPEWIWKAMEKSTIVVIGFPIGAHSLTKETRNWFRDHKIKQDGFQYYTRYELALAPTSYPDELYNAINVKVWKEIYGAKQIRVTDPYGTDLTVELDDGYWDRVRKDRSPNNPLPPEEPIHRGHIQISPMLTAKWEQTRGILAAIAMHADAVPLTKVTVQKGQVVKAEGEGHWPITQDTRSVSSVICGFPCPWAPE